MKKLLNAKIINLVIALTLVLIGLPLTMAGDIFGLLMLVLGGYLLTLDLED